MLGELADQATDGAADDHRTEQRRCEQAQDEAAGDAYRGTLEDVVVTAFFDVHRAVDVAVDEDGAIDEDDALALRLLQRVEVGLRHRRVVVSGDVQIQWCVAHDPSLS